MDILVTGASGNVGKELVALLQTQGAPVRAAVRKAPGTDYALRTVVLRFDDPTTYPEAFAGVDRLFLMRPPAITEVARYIKPVLDYAAQAAVKHVVFLSLIGADRNVFVPHAKVERLLIDGSIPYTLLRCGFFMQNLTTTHRDDIRLRDDIFIPAGRGKTAFIDVRDIAAVAAQTLTEPGHAGKAYPLTGGEALDYYAVAASMSAALGRPITYSDPSLLRFAWTMWRRGNPLAYVAVVAAIYTTTRFGLAAPVMPDTAQLLGRPPITLRQFVIDNAALWQR